MAIVSVLITALSLVQRNSSVPATVRVASRVVCHSPESCPSAAMSRVVVVESRVQVPVSFPTDVQVGAVICVQFAKLCPSAAMGCVSLCVASWAQVLVFIPAVVHVAAVVSVHAP
jgi:hypothetical protein